MLVSDVIAQVRPLTNHDVDTQFTDAQLVTLLSPRYLALLRKLIRIMPTFYTKVASWTLASGNTQDVTAAPLSLTDFDRVRRIRYQASSGSGGLIPLAVANPVDPEALPYGKFFVFLERGTNIDFYPSTLAAGNTFELSYLVKGVKLATTGDTLNLPDGADYVLAQYLAADIRVRFEEDPAFHFRMGGEAFADLKHDLQDRYGIHSEGLAQDNVW